MTLCLTRWMAIAETQEEDEEDEEEEEDLN